MLPLSVFMLPLSVFIMHFSVFIMPLADIVESNPQKYLHSWTLDAKITAVNLVLV